jgi:hypothetical protein
MSNWRPDNWENPIDKEYSTDLAYNLFHTYEAGADAMLESLKIGPHGYLTSMNFSAPPVSTKMTIVLEGTMGDFNTLRSLFERKVRGSWVFIPD